MPFKQEEQAGTKKVARTPSVQLSVLVLLLHSVRQRWLLFEASGSQGHNDTFVDPFIGFAGTFLVGPFFFLTMPARRFVALLSTELSTGCALRAELKS